MGFAFAPGAHDYAWWDGATATQATAKYVRSESHVGRSTYVYVVDVSGPLKDPGTVALLPPGGDNVMVPLTYSSATKTTVWVDKLSGTTVDADAHQTVTAQMKSKIGTVPLSAVLDVDTKMSPAGIADAVKQSKDDQSQLLWEGVVAPLALVILAAAFVVGAVVAGRRRRGADSISAAEV